ncbi:MAG: exonuclease SbcCD subunit D C-terminal domain-containing protein [Chitinophagaceae bacterium]
MRLIHTADWHLGQRFKDNLDRREEHEHFLNWLLQTIEIKKTDVLIIAGDIFDSPNPPPYAQQQYYSFLAKLYAQGICKDVVVTGGNHDSPDRLNAPKELLKVLNVHVVGAIPEDSIPAYIALPQEAPQPSVVIVAVPFLRDQDILRSQDKESISGREERIRQGIVSHYQKCLEAVSHFKDKFIPIIATGHLFAQGCEASPDSERLIHIGTLGQVSASDFPAAFDYIALGHLHRAQVVAGKNHIRYCGSPIPLSFSERDYKHQVVLLECRDGGKLEISSQEIPVLRQLKRVEGSLPVIKEKLLQLMRAPHQLTTWAELWIHSDESPVLVAEQVRKLAEEIKAEVRIVDFRQTKSADTSSDIPTINHAEALEDLQPMEVFTRLLDAQQIREGREMLLEAFTELLSQDDYPGLIA